PMLDYRKCPIDLLRTDAPDPGNVQADSLRALAYAFLDGKARRLRVRTTATSRYTPFYGGSEDVVRAGRHEISEKLREDVWVPSTFRPHVPEVDRVIPVFHWQEEHSKDGKVIHLNRESFIRMY